MFGTVREVQFKATFWGEIFYFAQDRTNWSFPSFSITTSKLFQNISYLSQVLKFHHQTKLCSKCFLPKFLSKLPLKSLLFFGRCFCLGNPGFNFNVYVVHRLFHAYYPFDNSESTKMKFKGRWLYSGTRNLAPALKYWSEAIHSKCGVSHSNNRHPKSLPSP